jgi:hypothetical protein
MLLADSDDEKSESCMFNGGGGKWDDLHVEEPVMSEPTPPELFDLEPEKVLNHTSIPFTDIEGQLYVLNRLPLSREQKVQLLIEEGVPAKQVQSLVK